MHPAATRSAVRRLYVRSRLPLSEAARQAGVSANTARGWKMAAGRGGDDWDRAREAARLAEGGAGSVAERVLADFSTLFAATMEAVKNSPGEPLEAAKAMATLADSYAKVARATARSDPQLARLGIALEVVERLAARVRESDPALLEPLLPHLEAVGEQLSREWK